MPEWSTYTLGDFLMFSPHAYWRLVERYFLAWWPAQLAGVAGSLAVIALLRHSAGPAHAIALALVGSAWLWTAWAFWWQQYAQIFIAAPWFALAAAVQGVLLLLAAWGHFRLRDRAGGEPLAAHPGLRRAGWVLCAVGVGYPLATLLAGLPATRTEVAGFMPDPTAWLTLGVLLVAGDWRLGVRMALALVPCWMLVLGALTRVLLAG